MHAFVSPSRTTWGWWFDHSNKVFDPSLSPIREILQLPNSSNFEFKLYVIPIRKTPTILYCTGLQPSCDNSVAAERKGQDLLFFIFGFFHRTKLSKVALTFPTRIWQFQWRFSQWPCLHIIIFLFLIQVKLSGLLSTTKSSHKLVLKWG